MKILFKIFSILLMVLMTVGVAEAKKGKGKSGLAITTAKNTCPTGLEGKSLKDAFPYYSHAAFEKAAEPKVLDPVSGPVMTPFSKNLKLGRGVYNVYAIDGDKTGIPSMDDLEPLVDMKKLQDYKIQELAVPGHCFLYVEEKLEAAAPAPGAAADDAQQHKSILLLVKNKNHSDISGALAALVKASKSTKGGAGGADADTAAASATPTKSDETGDEEEEDEGKKDEGADEKVFGGLEGKGADAATKDEEEEKPADEAGGDEAKKGDDTGDETGTSDAGGDDTKGDEGGGDTSGGDDKGDDDAGGDAGGGDDASAEEGE